MAIREIAVSGNLIQRRKLSALLKEQCSELADLKKMVEVHVVGIFHIHIITFEQTRAHIQLQ